MSKPLIAMWVGIGLLVLSWIFPPFDFGSASGFMPIFVNTGDMRPEPRIDFVRLALVDLAVITLTAGSIVTLRARDSN